MSEWEFTPEIVQFTEAARRYCGLLERAHEYDLPERLVRIAAAAAALYHAGLYLPFEAKPEDRDEPPIPGELSHWEGFEELSLFWQVPDAYAWGAPTVTSLNDTLLNTYRDVKRGLMIFERGCESGDVDEIAHAVWYWRHQMDEYWAAWTVDALRALNRAMQKVNSGQRDF